MQKARVRSIRMSVRSAGISCAARLDAALVAAEPGDAERLLELLAAWVYEEAGLDLERSTKLAAAYGYVAANRRAIEHYRIVPFASRARPRTRSTSPSPDSSSGAA